MLSGQSRGPAAGPSAAGPLCRLPRSRSFGVSGQGTPPGPGPVPAAPLVLLSPLLVPKRGDRAPPPPGPGSQRRRGAWRRGPRPRASTGDLEANALCPRTDRTAWGLLTPVAGGVPGVPRELSAGDGRTGAAGAGDPWGEAPRDQDMKPGPRLTHGDAGLLRRPPRGHRLLRAESPSSEGTCPTLELPKGPTGKGGCGPWVPGTLGVNVRVCAAEGLCWVPPCLLEAKALGTPHGLHKAWHFWEMQQEPRSWGLESQGFGHESEARQSGHNLAQPHVTWPGLSLPVCMLSAGTDKPSSKGK